MTVQLPLASAYAQAPTQDCTGEPKFTTFHDGSKGTVDYIWFTTDTAHCHGVVEMVPAGQLFHARSLPTEHHASDHLPLIADFSLP
jgi:mRNA deadenylase 3'-5' endonuclease subunit Ccr4